MFCKLDVGWTGICHFIALDQNSTLLVATFQVILTYYASVTLMTVPLMGINIVESFAALSFCILEINYYMCDRRGFLLLPHMRGNL